LEQELAGVRRRLGADEERAGHERDEDGLAEHDGWSREGVCGSKDGFMMAFVEEARRLRARGKESGEHG
jgi:hypothetical protein